MVELVLVVVVMAILAMLAIPRMDRDIRQEAADTVLSDIRYTQHLALIDDKQKIDEPKWQRSFWKISFEACSDGGIFVGIGSDMNYKGDIDENESAIDPSNGNPMFYRNTSSCKNGEDNNGGKNTVSSNIFLTKKYGITSVNGSGGCTGKHIGFDHLGRPHTRFTASNKPDYSSYMDKDCKFTFALSNGESFAISIKTESGYANIVGEDDS